MTNLRIEELDNLQFDNWGRRHGKEKNDELMD